MENYNLLFINGSLRPISLADFVLRTAIKVGMHKLYFDSYSDLELLPLYKKGNIAKAPMNVKELGHLVNSSDAVIIYLPEFNFGVPGSLHNLLDWMQATDDLNHKPVLLITSHKTAYSDEVATTVYKRLCQLTKAAKKSPVAQINIAADNELHPKYAATLSVFKQQLETLVLHVNKGKRAA